MFSLQCSVFSMEKIRWCRGLLAAHASPTVADKSPDAPASLDQLEHIYGVGCDGSQLGKEFCTTLHIPEHAYTSQHNSGTCRHEPEHASTFQHDRGTAFADAQAVVWTILTSLDRLVFRFSGRTSGRLGPCRQGIEVKRLVHRRERSRGERRFAKNWSAT